MRPNRLHRLPALPLLALIARMALLALLPPAAIRAQSRQVAITVDDLPFASGENRATTAADAGHAAEVNRKILAAFTRHHVPATGFVVEGGVGALGQAAGTSILSQWTGGGFDLGNHFYSHPDVNTLSVTAAEDEIVRGEKTFVPLMQAAGRKPAFLRFPFNHTGDTAAKHEALAAFIAARGYRLAPCTIDTSDYEFNATYALALARGDAAAAARVRADYLAYSAKEIDFYTALNHQVFGYDPPHIMLLHDSPLNADTIDDVLALFESRGYRFVTLAEAEKDPAYALPETLASKGGMMWGYRWAQEKGIKVNGRDEPDPPAWVEAYVKGEQPAR